MNRLEYDNPAHIDDRQWASLSTGGNPFMLREFHVALFETGCTGGDSGWDPALIGVTQSSDPDAPLLALAPTYLKYHSYGEYVFDWAWANAYQRSGLRYYPKLVAAAPFSPVTGSRLLLHADHNTDDTLIRLADATRDFAAEHRLSSIHWLFATEAETRRLEAKNWMVRTGCQFHWHNAGYRDFDAFLAEFASKKRKNVKRERRHVVEAGIRTEMIPGPHVDADTWSRFYRFYLSTAYKRGGSPYLTEAFFHRIGRTLGERVQLLVAHRGQAMVAAALYFRGDDCLYGRYWGCEQELDSLHFECCYYAPIEYCIRTGIDRFEAGAQGEHKLSRGLVPTTTWSAHWLAHPQFADAVAQFLAEERTHVAQYMNVLDEHAPFRRTTD
ncbi:MAG: GNAT family N-acetyltransferase [Pseudomonadota bacterium]|nr:GNAT family N-acetyltransferase [Pseudomonadota bacterium]